MSDHTCPTCGRGQLVRCGRKGLWERYVLTLFGLYPWRCGRCQTRFRLSDRGETFVRSRRKSPYPKSKDSGA